LRPEEARDVDSTTWNSEATLFSCPKILRFTVLILLACLAEDNSAVRQWMEKRTGRFGSFTPFGVVLGFYKHYGTGPILLLYVNMLSEIFPIDEPINSGLPVKRSKTRNEPFREAQQNFCYCFTYSAFATAACANLRSSSFLSPKAANWKSMMQFSPGSACSRALFPCLTFRALAKAFQSSSLPGVRGRSQFRLTEKCSPTHCKI
jgi:hypothetical protein